MDNTNNTIYFEIYDAYGFIIKIEAVCCNDVWSYRELPYTPFVYPPLYEYSL